MRHHPIDRFFDNILRNFFSGLSISIPVTFGILYLVTPRLQRAGLLTNSPTETLPLPKKKTLTENILVISIYVALFIFSLVAPFDKFWFGYGIICLMIALRFGFGEACLCILFVFLITFVLPSFTENIYLNGIFNAGGQLYFVLIGNLLMSLFAALTGRVISDLSMTEDKLNVKNQELQQTNEELDRFVYSVSHDLSAPLKSVQGLVNISRMDKDPVKKDEYLNKISQSVTKLDRFIREVLEYSQNKRLDIRPEKINLLQLAHEILSNIEHLESYQGIKIDTSELNEEVFTDRLRLKMILNNIISNAVKFQKVRSDAPPFVKISSHAENDLMIIEVEDNGEGIASDVQSKIFDMFYRGTLTSKGSGLGLFIAREAAIKLGGDISVESTYGKGSIFKIALKKEIHSVI
jgi:signal transduction histidine kinase